MERDRKYVLAIDPGTTTGLSVVRFEGDNAGRPKLIWADQLDWDEACDAAVRWVERLREKAEQKSYRVTAVGEMFQINANTARRGQQGPEDALGIMGVVKNACRLACVEWAAPQHASAAKKLVDDDALRTLHMHSPGLVHANDAGRHAVLLGVRRRWMEPGWFLGDPPR